MTGSIGGSKQTDTYKYVYITKNQDSHIKSLKRCSRANSWLGKRKFDPRSFSLQRKNVRVRTMKENSFIVIGPNEKWLFYERLKDMVDVFFQILGAYEIYHQWISSSTTTTTIVV